MPEISVVIPTRDRQELLHEAIQSVIDQTHQAKEIVIVDDASAEAVSEQMLRDKYGPSIMVVRNQESRGLAWARFRGVKFCTAEYVTHLDDDDLFDKNFLKDALGVFASNAEIEVLFVGVTGFGQFGQNFSETQAKALSSMLFSENQLSLYGSELFPLMLKKVPMAFQRVVTNKSTWMAISEFRMKAYAEVNAISDSNKIFDYLGGPLRDSEWSIYAASYCRKFALLNRPLYLQRCDGQGYSSREDQKMRHVEQSIIVKSTIYLASDKLERLIKWKKEIKNSVEEVLFDAAYYYLNARLPGEARRCLYLSFKIRPTMAQLKLLFKTFLPRRFF